MGGFSCACPSGFTISAESNMCQGQTERRLQRACIQLCTNKMLFFSFSLHHVDIDECLQGLHMCHYNQQCVNTVGAYRCQAKCGAGFKPSVTGTGCEGKLPSIQFHSVLSEMILRWIHVFFFSGIHFKLYLCSTFTPWKDMDLLLENMQVFLQSFPKNVV